LKNVVDENLPLLTHPRETKQVTIAEQDKNSVWKQLLHKTTGVKTVMVSPRLVEPTKKKIVADTDCRPNDVLFGRGSGASQHEGNRRFRGIVWETFQAHLQGEQARHCCRGEKLDGSFPNSLCTTTKSRICHVVIEKISKMNGRFLQKVTSASTAATTDNEESNNEVGKESSLTTYRIVDERQVLNKIKQTLRFLLDQKYGRNKRSHFVRGVTAATAGRGKSGETSFASPATPTGVLYQGQAVQDTALALPNDVVAQLLSKWQALPLPPSRALPHLLVPLQRRSVTSLDMDIPTQAMLILQQRQQRRRKEKERTLALLQSLGAGGDGVMALQDSNAGNASLQQRALAVSMALSHGGFLGYGDIAPG
jgi:hypothetical protein